MKFYSSVIIALLLSTSGAMKLRQLEAPKKGDEPVAPPRPTQAGWNTAANAIKKPGNETKCSDNACTAYSLTSDRTCCKAADEVEAPHKMPAYPFPKEPKKKAKSLA